MAKFVFIVQGEGRGHMSQSLAMRQFLERNGHCLETLYLGTGPFRKIPDYFMEAGEWVLKSFISPNFIQSHDRKGIRVWKSLSWNLNRITKYRKEIRRLTIEIKEINPEYVINFYDLVGSYVLRKLPKHITKICISHHFYFSLESFKMPPGSPMQRILLRRLNSIMSKGCDRVGALSFREEKDSVHNRVPVHVIPPLIRNRIIDLIRKPGKRNLVYLLHPGFVNDFIEIAQKNPDFEADIFLDAIPKNPIPPNLALFLPNDILFLEKMQRCRRLITTAGFDSVAEAALHSIPVIATPSGNHYEQQCNATDMQNAGFGITADWFTLENIGQSISTNNKPYLDWIKQSEKLLLRLIEK